MRWPTIAIGLVTGALLAGCHGGDASPPLPVFNGAGSWMARTASQERLIYASGDLGSGDVLIYDFSGNQVGKLGGFEEPGGLCSDSSGDVNVTDSFRGLIYEYVAGGTLPVNVLDDRGERPQSCAVDPTTGNVAVTNFGNGSNGNVTIFPPASGTPVAYGVPSIASYSFCGYDPQGNLYVDGTAPNHTFQMAALYKGSDNLVAVTVPGLNNKQHVAAAVQWDGQYIAVGTARSAAIYRLAISGSSATIVQTVSLHGWRHPVGVEFAISGKQLLFPNNGKLLLYKYPAGGRYKNGFLAPIGYDLTVTNGSNARPRL